MKTLCFFFTLLPFVFLCSTDSLYGTEPPPFDFAGVRRLPVQQEGRLKPLDTVAQNALLMIHGKQTLKFAHRTISPIEWLLDMMMNPERAAKYPIFRIDHPDVLALIEKTVQDGNYHPFEEVVPYYQEIRHQTFHATSVENQQRDSYQHAVVTLWQQISLYIRLNNTLFAGQTEDFPKEIAMFEKGINLLHSKTKDSQEENLLSWFLERYTWMSNIAYCHPLYPLEGEEQDQWANMGEGLLASLNHSRLHPGIMLYAWMTRYYQQKDASSFNNSLHTYQRLIQEHDPSVATKTSLEVFFNHMQPFLLSIVSYIIAFLITLMSWIVWPRPLQRLAFYILILGFLIHTAGLLARIAIEGRPPVTNLYSSALFVGWGAVLFGLILEKLYRNGMGACISAVIGGLTLIIAHHLSGNGDTMEMMQAVLNSNFWLSTHVIAITIGYSSTLLAGFFGCFFIFRHLIMAKHDPKQIEVMGEMLYGIVCISLFFSFIGTVLGGIWADQSWGRFWGWDPKENGALLIVLWNAIILHLRWAGLVKTEGLMILAVFGNVVTSFSWFGVNMLGVGLHAYGFIDQAFFWLAVFMTSQIIIMTLGLLHSCTLIVPRE